MWTVITHENCIGKWNYIKRAMELGEATNTVPYCLSEDNVMGRFRNLGEDFVVYYYNDGEDELAFMLRRHQTKNEWHVQQIRTVGTNFEKFKDAIIPVLEEISASKNMPVYIDKMLDHKHDFENYLGISEVNKCH
jgi:hypothetical protein